MVKLTANKPKMKNFIIIAIAAIGSTILQSCHNEKWEFPDYDFKAVYFPYQYPIRTLVLGEYEYDNENDKLHKFLISARIGGMYENKWNWKVNYVIDNSYIQNLVTNSGDTIVPLPSEYYELNPTEQIKIPAGQFYGSIEIQLKNAFFADTNAYKIYYAIPLKIVDTDADSIITGLPATTDPDPRKARDWNVQPKNFTIFAIKYVNPYHGNYLHRGQSIIKNESGNVIDTIIYHQRYVEWDEVWSLNTVALDEVTVKGLLRNSSGSAGNIEIKLTFDNNGNCNVSSTDNSDFPVTGTGKFAENADEWGNKKRNAIHLNYTVTENANTHYVTDTLVYRDKGVKFEKFIPVVID